MLWLLIWRGGWRFCICFLGEHCVLFLFLLVFFLFFFFLFFLFTHLFLFCFFLSLFVSFILDTIYLDGDEDGVVEGVRTVISYSHSSPSTSTSFDPVTKVQKVSVHSTSRGAGWY